MALSMYKVHDDEFDKTYLVVEERPNLALMAAAEHQRLSDGAWVEELEADRKLKIAVGEDGGDVRERTVAYWIEFAGKGFFAESEA